MLRPLAHLAAFTGLAAWSVALGRWLRDPEPGGALIGLVVLGVVVGLAVRRLYGPEGVAAVRAVEEAPPVVEEAPAPDPRLDLNTATIAELVTLPGVGPVSAQRILDDREANGPFATVEALTRVAGFGPAKVRAISDLVRAG